MAAAGEKVAGLSWSEKRSGLSNGFFRCVFCVQMKIALL